MAVLNEEALKIFDILDIAIPKLESIKHKKNYA